MKTVALSNLDRPTLGIDIALEAIVADKTTISVFVPSRVKNVKLESMVVRFSACHLVHFHPVPIDERMAGVNFFIFEFVALLAFDVAVSIDWNFSC